MFSLILESDHCHKKLGLFLVIALFFPLCVMLFYFMIKCPIYFTQRLLQFVVVREGEGDKKS